MRYAVFLTLLTALSCCPYGQTGRESDIPHGSDSPEVNRIFESYLFLSYPGVEHFGGQRVRSTKGKAIVWNGFTSSDPVDKVVAYYLEKMGKQNYHSKKKGLGGSWRFHNQDPQRVLSIYPIEEKGPHLGYKEYLARDSKTVIIISRR